MDLHLQKNNAHVWPQRNINRKPHPICCNWYFRKCAFDHFITWKGGAYSIRKSLNYCNRNYDWLFVSGIVDIKTYWNLLQLFFIGMSIFYFIPFLRNYSLNNTFQEHRSWDCINCSYCFSNDCGSRNNDLLTLLESWILCGQYYHCYYNQHSFCVHHSKIV